MARRTIVSTAALVGSVLLAAGCTNAASSPDPDTETAGSPPATVGVELHAEDVATDLTTPWGLALLSDGSALVSERDTREIHHVAPDGTTRQVGTIEEAEPMGEGGLLGLAVSEDEDTVFVYYTADSDNRVVSAPFDGEQLGPQTEILSGIPESGRHNGGQLTIGPDGFLYVATGDAAEAELSQDTSSLAGKILRVTAEGEPAPDNPYDNEVFSLGHRNVQGLAFDEDGNLWASEFGDSSWDELNLITPGGNYGWPAAEGSAQVDDMINPKVVWKTSDASPSGLAYWDGSLWMAGLRGERLWEIRLHGADTGDPVAHFTDTYGRLRAVQVTPDGDGLWLGTSNTDGRGDTQPGDDRILKITR